MQFSTTPTLEGQTITEYCGVVTGEAILGANIFRDFFAGIRDIVGRSIFHGPAQDTQFLAKRGMNRHGLSRIFVKFGGRQTVGTKAAIGFFPIRRRQSQPATPVNHDTQRRVGGGQ